MGSTSLYGATGRQISGSPLLQELLTPPCFRNTPPRAIEPFPCGHERSRRMGAPRTRRYSAAALNTIFLQLMMMGYDGPHKELGRVLGYLIGDTLGIVLFVIMLISIDTVRELGKDPLDEKKANISISVDPATLSKSVWQASRMAAPLCRPNRFWSR